MRFAFSVVGFVVSAGLVSLACLMLVGIAHAVVSSIFTRSMWFTVGALLTAAVVTNPVLHDGQAGRAVAGGVSAGLVVAFGFFVLSYLELVGFRP